MNLRFLLLFCGLALQLLPLGAQDRGNDRRVADRQYALGSYHDAAAAYRRRVEARPDDTHSLLRLANTSTLLNQLDSARHYYERAMMSRHVDPSAMIDYGLVLMGLGEYTMARTLFENYAREGKEAALGSHLAAGALYAAGQRTRTAGFVVSPLEAVNTATDAEYGPGLHGPGRMIYNKDRMLMRLEDRPRLQQRAVEIGGGYPGPVSYSPSGREVLITRNTFPPGVRMVPEANPTLALYIAEVGPAGQWRNPRPLPFNESGYSSGFATWGPDENTVYFASNRPGGAGGYDIYRARRDTGIWRSVPENMGRVVNTPGHEITPYRDGNSLYFSSNFHHGMGLYDVFRAELEGENPAALYHLGSGVNSPRDDYGFVYSELEARGYMVTNRGAEGGDTDIYAVDYVGEGVTLEIVRIGTLDPIDGAEVELAGCGGGLLTTDRLGRVEVPLDRSAECNIVVTAPGFQPLKRSLGDLTVKGTRYRLLMVPLAITRGSEGPIEGTVSDAQTGQLLAGARVQLKSRASSQTLSVSTDTQGSYRVELDTAVTYDVTVSAYGYEDVTFPVFTRANRSNADVLGNTALLPGRSATITAPPPAPGAQGPATPVYRVQLGAYARPRNFSTELAAELGEISSERRGELTVFFVNDINRLSNARAVRQRAEELGFIGAFVLRRDPTSRNYLKVD